MNEDSIQIARKYMDSLLVEGRIIGADCHPSTEITFCGHTFSTPIMTAALSHIDLVGMADGAQRINAPVSIGMGENAELADVLATGAKVMKIIKPYADPEAVYSRIRFAEEHGAMAVGMDVEHAVNTDDPGFPTIHGLPMKLPTMEELKAYAASTRLPFFAKGVLSPQDAVRCRDMGFAGAVISHHNGLMRCAVPPVMALPRIRKAVGNDFILIVDGGIETGFDAFKALALGADMVTVGKKLMDPLKEKGPEGVTETLQAMTNQLQVMMIRTDSKDLKHIDPDVIIHTAF